MRLLHTADWHVGKTIRGRGRADEHRTVLAEMVDIARKSAVQIVLVAGDLFESASPAPESEQIVYSALMQFARVAEHVVVIGGNHDNQRRLEAVQPLLALTNVHVTPSVARPDAGGVLNLVLQSGERVRLAMLPFVSQRGIVRADDLMAADAMDHSVNYADRLCQIVGTLCSPDPNAVNVLVAHAMVIGGKLGGGEREAHTIFDYSIPTSAFPAHLHYVALGHLHRAQSLPGRVPIEYAGAPLDLDFGDEGDSRSVVIVEAVHDKPANTERIGLTTGRRLRTMRGTLDEIRALATGIGEDYLRVEVTDKVVAPGLADDVRTILPNALEVRISAQNVRTAVLADRVEAMKRSPRELFEMYLTECDASDEAVVALFRELLEERYAADAS